MTRIHGHRAPRLSRAAVFALGMALSAPGAFALPQSVAPPAESAQAPKVAVTAEDHLAKAAEYRKKAASYREGHVLSSGVRGRGPRSIDRLDSGCRKKSGLIGV